MCLLAYRSTYNARIMDLPMSSFVSHFFLLTAQGVDSRQHNAWFPVCKRELSIFSVVTGLIVEALLILLFFYNAV